MNLMFVDLMLIKVNFLIAKINNNIPNLVQLHPSKQGCEFLFERSRIAVDWLRIKRLFVEEWLHKVFIFLAISPFSPKVDVVYII